MCTLFFSLSNQVSYLVTLEIYLIPTIYITSSLCSALVVVAAAIVLMLLMMIMLMLLLPLMPMLMLMLMRTLSLPLSNQVSCFITLEIHLIPVHIRNLGYANMCYITLSLSSTTTAAANADATNVDVDVDAHTMFPSIHNQASCYITLEIHPTLMSHDQ
jgi:hypothetical protein